MEQPKQVIDQLKDFIRSHSDRFQLNAHFATIVLQPAKTADEEKITFGRYQSERHRSYPFYKPYSKIINIKSIT